MYKTKILRLCNEIEDIAEEIQERTMKNSYFMAQTIINKVLVIAAEITAPPKTNADRIRQMTDEELAKFLHAVQLGALAAQFSTSNGIDSEETLRLFLAAVYEEEEQE